MQKAQETVLVVAAMLISRRFYRRLYPAVLHVADHCPTSRNLHFSSKLRHKAHKRVRYMGRFCGFPVRITNEGEAASLISLLKENEKDLLLKVLTEEKSPKQKVSLAPVPALSSDQVKSLFMISALPFVGFGFLDNFIMIMAGEYIDLKMGIIFGLSTMAAAGFGNTISDVCGMGLANYVESVVGKIGIRTPALTPEQWETSKARWTSNLGRAFGLAFGCLVGMFPLLFFSSDKDHSQDEE